LLSQIFGKKNKIDIIQDKITEADLVKGQLRSQSNTRYFYDYLILALGSQTTYFGIEGLEEYAYGFKSIEEALNLKSHLHKIISQAKLQKDQTKKIEASQIIVVGGGASGVELAGELASYSKKIARFHGLDPSLITIDLIEAAPRILPIIDEEIAAKAEKHLRALGVNIFTNRVLAKEQIDKAVLRDMQIGSQTLVWTAGVKPNDLYSKIKGLNLDKRGKVIVGKNLLAKGAKNVFIIGDGASTQYSGMAQTAIDDGSYVANRILGLTKDPHRAKKPYFSIPVGDKWAVTQIGRIILFGRIGWWLRRLADLRYFLSILPINKAFRIFRYDMSLSESCGICAKANSKK
jgi:NADH dehydrogenase